jgi:hypothetical protein
VSQSSRITLAEGQIVPGAKLTVVLDDDNVVIVWPTKPTTVGSRRYDEISSRATRVLANASIALAARRAHRPGRRPKLDL